MTQTEILCNTKLKTQNGFKHYRQTFETIKMKKPRDKLSLHLFISCKQNSQDPMMFGAPNKKLPKTAIKFQVNSKIK